MTADSRVQHIDTQVRLARAVVENLRPAELAAELLEGNVALIDVREPDELGGGTIGGAINVPRGIVELVAISPFIPLAKPDAKFQPIWVEDVAQVFVNALDNTATYGKIYELGGPSVYTLRELVQKVMNIVGKQRPIIGLNDQLSMAQAWMMELMPIKLMSRDNVLSMQVDNVCNTAIAPELAVTPTAMDVVVPAYLNNVSPRGAYDGFRSAAGRAINARR